MSAWDSGKGTFSMKVELTGSTECHIAMIFSIHIQLYTECLILCLTNFGVLPEEENRWRERQ